MNKIILFNPRSANKKYRIPNSVLQVAASINNQFSWVIVDGNRELDPFKKLIENITIDTKYIGFTVMPGPQLKQAIPFAKLLKT